ncbi:hypothetical protein GPALN_004849 [Globodera pallida]|nr:hypothetical protein GPALN_004849 [Globodera pallida]
MAEDWGRTQIARRGAPNNGQAPKGTVDGQAVWPQNVMRMMMMIGGIPRGLSPTPMVGGPSRIPSTKSEEDVVRQRDKLSPKSRGWRGRRANRWDWMITLRDDGDEESLLPPQLHPIIPWGEVKVKASRGGDAARFGMEHIAVG